MDSHTWNHKPPPRPDPPDAPRIATLFRLEGASHRPLRFATYAVATGTELRVEYEDVADDIIRTQLFRGPNANEEIAAVAADWRSKFDGRGFRELPIL